jgi:hypothetical protein
MGRSVWKIRVCPGKALACRDLPDRLKIISLFLLALPLFRTQV